MRSDDHACGGFVMEAVKRRRHADLFRRILCTLRRLVYSALVGVAEFSGLVGFLGLLALAGLVALAKLLVLVPLEGSVGSVESVELKYSGV
jgi:hypothetical protein